MPVHVKMLDKDGVGFRQITVQDPACLQLVATDPDIGDYPVLRVGHASSGIINYPLTNDAYIMNEAGGTISKINFKDCLREVGKEESGMRPDRRSLSQMPPFDEFNRKATKTLYMILDKDNKAPKQTVQSIMDQFVGAESIEASYKSFCTNTHFDANMVEKENDHWTFHVNGKRARAIDFSASDLEKMRVGVYDENKEAFEEYFRINYSELLSSTDQCLQAIQRNVSLCKYHMDVVGTWSPEIDIDFTPIVFDPELGNQPYVQIDGVKKHLNELSMGDVLMHNVFFLEPLGVNPDLLEQPPEVINQLMKASTVFYFNNPGMRKDGSVAKGWIDYTFHHMRDQEKVDWSAVAAPKVDLTPAPTIPTRLQCNDDGNWCAVIEGVEVQIYEMNSQLIALNRIYLHTEDENAFDAWDATKKKSLRMDPMFDEKVKLVKAMGVMIATPEDQKNSSPTEVFLAAYDLIEVTGSALLENFLNDKQSINSASVEKLVIAGKYDGQEVEFVINTSNMHNTRFMPSIASPDYGTHVLNTVITNAPVSESMMTVGQDVFKEVMGETQTLLFDVSVAATYHTPKNLLKVHSILRGVGVVDPLDGKAIPRSEATEKYLDFMDAFKGEVKQVVFKVINN